MIGRGGTLPVPNFGVAGLGSTTLASAGSSISFTTNQAILPGESALHVLTNGNTSASFFFDPSNQGSATTAYSFATNWTQQVKYRNYPTGLAAGTSIQWVGGTYTAGATAASIRIYGNSSLAITDVLSGTLAANTPYYSTNNSTFLTGTRFNTSPRSTFTWICLTSGNANAILNGLGQSGLATATYSVVFNTGNANDATRPQMTSAVVAFGLQNQYPGTGVYCLQRHGVGVTALATTWLFVAP
jgi:hypothetical protein